VQGGELDNPLGSITEKGFDDTFNVNVNVRGTLFTVQKALPLMKDGGSIILNSSIAGVKGFPGTTVYSASKAAVRSFARTWTAELKGRIRVNVISPGTIDTAIFDGTPQELKDGFVSIIPMGRMGKPTRSLPLRSFSRQMIPALLPASSYSSMAAQHRSN
jgi:NAD(P)-dependent dehydrogenase (short-subunit alcohol dehydrogenase family)